MSGSPQRFTATVSDTRNFTTIEFRAVGVFRTLNLNQTAGRIADIPLLSSTSSDGYWLAVLQQIIPQLHP